VGEAIHTVHWALRYLVLLAAVVAMVAAVIGLRRPDSGAQRPALLVFVGLLDLQVLVGLGLLLVWPYYPALIGHIAMMVLAAVVAHGGSVLARRRATTGQAAAIRLGTVVLALILIIGGIQAIQRPIL
jgi:hypothetical protein